MTDLKIIKFEKEHAPLAAEIERECFSHPWSEKALAEEADNENARFYMAFLGDEAAGYAGMHCVCGECYIDNIAVKEKFRGFGIGKKLVETLCGQGKAEKSEFITLEVRESNIAARKLYEKFGFTVRGVRKNFYEDPKEDGVLYTLDFEREDTE